MGRLKARFFRVRFYRERKSTMEIYPMLTGSQLRQYLHISTRKLKYLMDHDYIPHEDTGQATYRYRVRWEDAVEFKRRMEEEPGFLGELAGQFSSHHPPKPRPKREPAFQPTPENCQRFRQWLAQRWANEPDALPTQRAAELLGRTPQTLHRWVKLGKLPATQVGRFQYCPKGELLRFLATPEQLPNCRELLRLFLAQEG